VALGGSSHRIKKARRDRRRPDWPRLGYANPGDKPYVRFQRISSVAAHCGDRLLSGSTAGIPPWRREPLL